MKIIITLTIIIGLIIGFCLAIGPAIRKSEDLECQKWQIMSEEYPGFYWTSWQKEQCNIK